MLNRDSFLEHASETNVFPSRETKIKPRTPFYSFFGVFLTYFAERGLLFGISMRAP